MLFKVFSCIMALLLLIMPCLTFAQQTNDAVQAIADATRDAKYAPNSSLWFPAGCLLGVVGILVAAVYTPHPPATKLLGKSPEYVAYYTSTYQQVAKDEQIKDAIIGCVFSGCLTTAAYAWIISQTDLVY